MSRLPYKIHQSDKPYAPVRNVLRGLGMVAEKSEALDLIVADWTAIQQTWFCEVKDGEKSPAKRRLTPREARFMAHWPGPAAIVLGVADAVQAAEDARAGRLRPAHVEAERYRDATEPDWRRKDALGGGR